MSIRGRHSAFHRNRIEEMGITQPNLPKDVLASKQFQTLVELLGEGEIEGFPSATGSQGSAEYDQSALKDVFLNGTQVLQQAASTSPSDEDFNFQNITFEPRFGTSNQTAIQGISEIETENAVGVVVTKDTPVSRSITNTSINAVRVTIAFPQLQKFEDNGDINGSEVALTIQTIENDGTTTTVISDTVKGRTASTYFRDYKINLKSSTSFPVTIRVNRTTADSTESTHVNAFQWSSFTEIINESRAYANSAHVALRFDAETFPAQPRRMYRIRGTKIKIPHNATVRTDGSLSYSGTFNGSFKADKAWTNDPAWILYDLLTTSKGFGDHIAESQLDVFSFFAASQYASAQVDDGQGGTEPRFACNVVINTRKEAYNLINELCSVMRVMPFYSAGAISISCDKPTDASYLFNLSNVMPEGFTYSNTSKSTKHTVVNVAYFDNETQTIDYETVEDTALQAKYGQVVKNLKGFATTSRGQASRLGKWFLYTQSNEAQTVTFTTTLEAGTLVRPGAVINIQDPMRAGVRRGGRIKTGVSTTQIIVDDENNTDLATTDSATLSVILSDGSLETKSISDITGTTITVDSAFSSVPQANSVWVIENTSLQLQIFRVISVTEVSQLNYQIVGVSHDPNKYNFVEDGTSLTARTITTLTAIKDSPSNLQGTEQIVVLNNRAVSKLFIQWQPVSGVTEYLIQYRFKNENFISENISRPDFTIFETLNGTYEVRVFSYNALGKPSINPATTTFTTVGKTAIPADVTGLLVEPVSDQLLRLRFNQSTDVDVLHGGNVVVRHSNLTNGTGTFTNSVDIIPRLPGSVSETLVPAIDGEYILKFRDDGGRLSSGEASVVVTNPDPLPKLVTFTDREDTDSPPFGGTKVDCFFSEDVNGLVLGSLETLDDVTDFDAIADFDFLGAVDITGGSYDFANILDLGSVHPLRLTRHFVTQGFYPNDLIDKRTANIDTWTDFDSATAFDVNAKLLVATTTAAPSNGSSYQDSDFTGKTFNTFANGTHIGRGFKFRCEMDSDDPAQSIEIDQLGYTAELDRRTEQKSNLSSGTSSSGLAVTFDHAFFTGATGTDVAAGSQLPSIGITANDLSANERFELTSITGSGFNIKFLNAGNAVQDKTFSYTAVGFGRGS